MADTNTNGMSDASTHASRWRDYERVAGLFLTAALAAMIAISLGGISDYWKLYSRLRNQPFLERGQLGNDEWNNFLARAGRVRMRKSMAEAYRRGASPQSAIARSWSVVMRSTAQMPPGAKVYLQVPDLVLYFFGTFALYPRPLSVHIEPVLVKDGETLAANSQRITEDDIPRMKALGYTHIIARSTQGVVIIDMREEKAGQNK